MILGIGTDIAKIARFSDNLEKFAQKHLSQREQAEISARKENLQLAVAKRFSAKEACAKALGTGFRDGLFLKNIEILHRENGSPYAVFSAKAQEILNEISGGASTNIFISISDDGEYAQTFAVIEKL